MANSSQSSFMPSSSWLNYISFGGFASLGVSALFFQLAGLQDGRISELGRAHELESLAGAALLEPALPLLVAARGRLVCRQPAKCELGGEPAVMRELVEEEVYFKEHSSGRVTQESFEVRREQEQREAFLEDVSARVKVENLQHAAGLPGVMEVRQAFRPVDLLQGTLIQHVLNKAFKSMVKHGVRSTERYLPTHTTVTVVGELLPDVVGAAPGSSGGSALDPGSSGGPFQQPAQPQNLQIEASPLQGDRNPGQQPPHEYGHSSSSADRTRPSEASTSSSPSTYTASTAPTTPHHPDDAAAAAAVSRDGGATAGTSGRTAAALTSPSAVAAEAAAAAVTAAGAELLGQAVVAAGSAAARVLPYTLRMPAAGHPFIVTTRTLPQLRSAMERTSGTLRAFAWGFGMLGAVLVARKVALQLWHARDQRRLKRMLAEAETARRQRKAQRAAAAAATGGQQGATAGAVVGGGGGEGGEGGEGGDDDSVRGPGTCVVCLDRDTDVVFSGCGHMCTCYACSASLHKCPICRVASRTIRVYRP